jgi:hypothetical protein
MSASSMPTVAPSTASASARFTAVVLLPTPPLPEATAMMFLIPGTSFTPRCTAVRDDLRMHVHARVRHAGQPREPLGHLRAHLLQHAARGITERHVERDAIALDLHVLHRLRFDVIAARDRVDQLGERREDVLVGGRHADGDG